MIKIELDEKTLLGLLVGTDEERIEFLSDTNIIASLNMPIIKKVYQHRIDKSEPLSNDYMLVITLLQGLAYNRHKSKYKDEIGIFVLDKLFELITTGDIC
jgi:hypothetical protein